MLKRPTIEEKLIAWQTAYDAIREHVLRAYGVNPSDPKWTDNPCRTDGVIEAAYIAAAASLVGGIQW